MSKELTEQWYKGTIDTSFHYYVRIKGKEEMNCGGIDFIDIIRPPLFRDQFDKLMRYNDPEVLSIVPSYDEYKRLQEQINNANMVINKCLTLTNDYDKKCFLEGYKIMWGVK